MLLTKKVVIGVQCDRCSASVEVDASSRKEALSNIGAVESYGEHPSWARVPAASAWSNGFWLSGQMVDLCPRCYVAEDRERQRRQGPTDDDALVAEYDRRVGADS